MNALFVPELGWIVMSVVVGAFLILLCGAAYLMKQTPEGER